MNRQWGNQRDERGGRVARGYVPTSGWDSSRSKQGWGANKRAQLEPAEVRAERERWWWLGGGSLTSVSYLRNSLDNNTTADKTPDSRLNRKTDVWWPWLCVQEQAPLPNPGAMTHRTNELLTASSRLRRTNLIRQLMCRHGCCSPPSSQEKTC